MLAIKFLYICYAFFNSCIKFPLCTQDAMDSVERRYRITQSHFYHLLYVGFYVYKLTLILITYFIFKSKSSDVYIPLRRMMVYLRFEFDPAMYSFSKMSTDHKENLENWQSLIIFAENLCVLIFMTFLLKQHM